ncbi:MAG: sodium:solute symporter family protein [Janthinobacterium lividum]
MTPDLRAAFAPIDWAILALYFVFLLTVGFWKRRQTTEDYVIAGRSLGLPVFVATLVATWYGGILGQGEFVYDNGLLAWTTNGLPYYVFALLFALFLAKRVRLGAVSIYTIPDKLAAAYDKKTALLGAVFAFLYAAPATYVLMAGTILHILFGWPLLYAMLAGIVFSVVYVFRGGFLSDVRVNVLQFLLMFAGFGTSAWLCLTKLDGLAYLNAPGHLPPTHLKLLGDQHLGYAVVWFFIALVTLTDPGFHQRCYAAKTPRVAALGIGLAVLCWMVFDALTTTTGLFARALVPGLTDSKMAYPALAEHIMPPGIKGLFYVGMLAPVMASIVSYTFIAAMTIGRDFIWRLRADTDDRNLPAYTRLGLGLTSAVAILIAFAIPSVVNQWYFFGSILVPGLLIPLLGAYATTPRWKAPADFAFASMLLGASVSFACLLWGWGHGGFDNPQFLLNCQPMYPGLLIAALVYGLGLLRTGPADMQ